MAEDHDVMRLILALALSLVPLAAFAPAAAQQRSLTIFGDDKCPSDTICVVAPETERYRIPKLFREGLRKDAPDRVSWAIRSQATLSEGKSGPDRCAPATADAGNGCFIQQMKAAYAEKKPAPEVP